MVTNLGLNRTLYRISSGNMEMDIDANGSICKEKMKKKNRTKSQISIKFKLFALLAAAASATIYRHLATDDRNTEWVRRKPKEATN